MQKDLSILEKIYKNGNFSGDGLKNSDISVYREKYGKNVITQKKSVTVFKRIQNALFEPMMLILMLAFFITLGVNIGNAVAKKEADFIECIGIFCAIVLSVGLTVVMENKSEKAFKLLKSFSDNVSVNCIRNGEKRIIGNAEVCVGDVLFLESGEKAVADGVILECEGLETDESTLTGESVNVKKEKYSSGAFQEKNIIYSGSYVKSGNLKMLVLAVGDNAAIGKIAKGLEQGNNVSAPLNEKLSKLSKSISIFGALSALAVFLLTLFRLKLSGTFNAESFKDAFVEGIVLIVAAVPEGLPTTVAISLALSVVKLAGQNALIKKLVAAETVGCVSVICSDKTGTLTFGKMEVNSFIVNSRKISLNDRDFKVFYENIIYNSTAEYLLENDKIVLSGNSTEQALISYLFSQKPGELKSERNRVKYLKRLPFASENKYMFTTVQRGEKEITYYKGSIEKLIELSDEPLAVKQKTLLDASFYERQAERILAFAHSENGKMKFDGFCCISDKIRPDVSYSISECKKAGIEVKILTGDNKETALSIAAKTGLKHGEENCITGDEAANLTDEELIKILPQITVVARSAPETKLRIVRLLKRLGEVVAVTGDGVNDAPAVKNADIGIAMGDGSEITKEASDIILLDNSFSVIVKAVTFGRNIYRNFQSFLFFQLTVNFSAVGLILFFLILGFQPPFSTLQLLWINVIMDGPLALSLGLERRDNTFLDDKPVKRTDSIVPRRLFVRIIMHAVYIVGIIVLQKNYNFLSVSEVQNDTVIFCFFVLFQLFNGINAREIGGKSVIFSFGKNKMFSVLLFVSLAFQFVLTQYMGGIVETQSLSAVCWIKIIAISFSIVVISEAYKLFYRAFGRNFRKKIFKRRKFA